MITVVYFKEMRDHWRDRRSVFGALLLPILGPFLLIFALSLIEQQVGEFSLEIPVEGAEHAPELIAFFQAAGAEIVAAPEDPKTAVADGAVPLVLRVDEEFTERFRESRSAPVELVVDDSNQASQRDIRMVRQLLGAYAEQLTNQRLIARGIAPSVTRPIALRERSVSRPEESSVQLLGMIPLLLLLATFTGGMNVAIDATAGERERDSLEPLLLNPVPRWQIVLGKWLATSTFALGVVGVAILGFVVTMQVVDTSEFGLPLRFGLGHAASAYLLLAPLALLASALQMLVATFARTFKEAQTYLSLVSVVPIAPALYLMLDPQPTAAWMMALPALGQVAAMNDVLGGNALDPIHVAIVWGTSLAYLAAALYAVSRLLRRETIIFGR